ncbi:hypothetical protein HWV62_26350 [Athelia sp. TMB]|nr:hypothetical protein HWV62_26350 [Athelia sp. TMB]
MGDPNFLSVPEAVYPGNRGATAASASASFSHKHVQYWSMVGITPSPSPFATLLRRSKFSSFDPQIAQVFASYDGDAHRGNWGFKRPLALRHRRAHITVKAVDTSSQQTEWNGANSQVKFIRKWEELNTGSKRSNKPHEFKGYDSEFSPMEDEQVNGGLDNLPMQPVRNINAMKPKQFQTYLKQLRAQRSDFIEFLEQKGDERLEDKTMYERAQLADNNFHGEFIATRAAQEAETMDSRYINKMGHRSGGLSYSSPSSLQSYLTTKPQPGRVLQAAPPIRGKPEKLVVAFGGLTHSLEKRQADGVQMIKWSEPASKERGIARFRLRDAHLYATPVVVGKRQGAKAVKIRGEVQIERKGYASERSNNYTPGSQAYAGALASPGAGSGVANFSVPPVPKRSLRAKWEPSGGSKATLETLRAILGGQPSGSQ